MHGKLQMAQQHSMGHDVHDKRINMLELASSLLMTKFGCQA